MKRFAVALICCVGMAAQADASIITMDLTSGTASAQNTSFGFDNYDEDGFNLEMVDLGTHFDLGFIGDIGVHNGPVNPDNVKIVLTKIGGGAFDLLSVDLGGFANGATALFLTSSSAATQTISSAGSTLTPGFTNVTFVQFDIGPDGGTETVGFNELVVNDEPITATPEPVSMALLGLTTLGGVGLRLRRNRKAQDAQAAA